MKVRCIENTGKNLLQSTLDSGYTRDFSFGFCVGREYIVYGVRIIENYVSYLLLEDPDSNPFWEPAELFEVCSKVFPPFFYFNVEQYKDFEGNNKMVVLFGYKEMIFDEKHHDDLIDREKRAIDIFRIRKEEIDEFEMLYNDKDFI